MFNYCSQVNRFYHSVYLTVLLFYLFIYFIFFLYLNNSLPYSFPPLKLIPSKGNALIFVVCFSIGGFKKIMTVGEFSDIDWASLNETQLQEVMENSAFKLEMGKCIIHEMFCVGKNSLDTPLKDVKVCQRRE